MYTYSWYHWITFFYLYCFFGWIFESAYVSLRQKRFVNRGFLRLPLLPLYGTGAVMMLDAFAERQVRVMDGRLHVATETMMITVWWVWVCLIGEFWH